MTEYYPAPTSLCSSSLRCLSEDAGGARAGVRSSILFKICPSLTNLTLSFLNQFTQELDKYPIRIHLKCLLSHRALRGTD